MLLPAVKAAALLFFVVVVQVTIVGSMGIFGGAPDLMLVMLVAVALLNGAVFGAFAGFWTGLLLDVALIQTLGFSSLLLTLAGFWTGRYGETTGRNRSHAPLVSVAVVTVLYAVAALILHFMLGDPASARIALVDALPPELVLNLLLAVPVFALCRRLFAPPPPARTQEVEFG
ncbi:MAG TPA: rod shape-determining protein MreD [Gaiellaceae bacterium]|jgi:rod shape-determining protein MreD|nr:rod shape-determining protein MreD [Gaiellaceae bacterium]